MMTTRFQKKKTIVFPAPKSAYEYAKDDSFVLSVRRFALSMSLRLLNERRGQLSQDELTDVLTDLLYEHGSQWIDTDYERQGLVHKGRLTTSQVDEMAEGVSVLALSVWSPDYMAVRRRAGAKGGTKSKRPAQYTPDILDAVAGLSRAEQAKALGVSTATVGRLRKRQKAEIVGECRVSPQN